MTPRSAAEQGPRTRAGHSLLRQWSGHVNEPEVRIVVLAIEAEAEATAAADAWQAGYEACWNRLKDAGRLLPSDGATASVPLDVERLAQAIRAADYTVHKRVAAAATFIAVAAEFIAIEYARLSGDEEGGTA